VPFENRTPHEEYEPLNQPERIDRALQSLLEIHRQIKPVGLSNKQEIQAAIIALNFMLASGYDEVLERDPSGNDELAEETHQDALRTLERYIQHYRKEPAPNVDADLTSDTDFAH
jgi:hypothetical protein